MPSKSTTSDVTRIDETLFAELRTSAKQSDRKRAHHNLHADADESFQRMIVGMEPGSYIRPHIHFDKPELLVCLSGRLGILIFAADGNVETAMRLEPGGAEAGCDIPVGHWHSIVSLDAGTVFLEAKPGPYVPFSPDDFATWAPEAGSDAADEYLASLMQKFE